MRIITGVAIVAASIGVILMVAFGVKGCRVVSVWKPVVVNTPKSPLELALDYESSDSKFAELVQKHADWLPYRSEGNDAHSLSILSKCALLLKTNYVRILIAHGANVAEAVEWHQNYGASVSVELLRQVQRELENDKNK